jgi:DMSO/TMAO reductase YedYZ molybdopterin-dependent catalytic subunit
MAKEQGVIYSPDTRRKDRVPPGHHLAPEWPVLHYDSIPKVDTAYWRFFIKGLVDHDKSLNFAEFSALPRVKVFSDVHCVTTWSKLDNMWEGPSTKTVLGLVKVDPKAKFVIVHGAEGFTTNLALSDFLAEDALFTLTHDGQPLSAEHGAPVRLIVPRLYLWKSAKWATGIELVEKDAPGFWERAGYHNHGDPWTEERRQW